MQSPFKKKHESLPLLSTLSLAVFLSLTGTKAEAISVETLLNQATRPTVQQTLDLMKEGWKPEKLRNASELPRVAGKGDPSLQFDFPRWYAHMVSGAPRMIACFEKAFPGAKFAFLGRDSAPLADFFEAFYLSLGQTDRVVRIGMSSSTVESLKYPGPKKGEYTTNIEAVFDLLKKHGFDPNEVDKMKHPYVLVDSISRQGGSQGRLLLSTVYSRYFGDHAGLAQYLNFIGLRVATTELGFQDVCDGYNYLNGSDYVGHAKSRTDYSPGMILSYSDGRKAGEFEGVNEAGYTHWVGFWHGPFGPMSKLSTGEYQLPEPGPSEWSQFDSFMPQMKGLVLDYQAALIRAAMDKNVHKAVFQAAQALGYEFPIRRPYFHPRPLVGLKRNIEQAKSIYDLSLALGYFDTINFNRAPRGHAVKTVIDGMSRQWSSAPDFNQKEAIDVFLELAQVASDYQLLDYFFDKNTAAFFLLAPSPEDINALSGKLDRNSPTYFNFIGAAIRYIAAKDHATAIKEFNSLQQPNKKNLSIRNEEYQGALAEFKKTHGSPRSTIKKTRDQEPTQAKAKPKGKPMYRFLRKLHLIKKQTQ